MVALPSNSFTTNDALARAPLAGTHVLIADDNPVNLEVATFHVENLGATFATALNGSLALGLVRQHAFDFVLMDCQMPVMDGFEALHSIRAHEAATGTRRATIIAVTASDDAESQTHCAQAGFDGFLAKPFTAAQLQNAMARARTDHQVAVATAKPIAAKIPTGVSPILDDAIFQAFVAEFGEDTAPSLLGSFVKLLHESQARFASALATHNTKELQSIAHKVAGASGTVGAARLALLSREIQVQCKRNEFKWSANIADFDAALVDTISTFKPYLASNIVLPA